MYNSFSITSMNDIKYFGKYDSKYESIFRLQIFLLSLPRVKPSDPSPSPFPIPQKNGTRKGWLSAECFIFQKNKSPSLFHWCPFRLGILQFNNLPTLKLRQSGSTVQRASAQYSSTKSTKKQISQYQTIFQEKTLRHSAISSAQHCGKPPEQSHHDLPISKTTHNPSNKYIAFSIIVCSGFLLASLYPRAAFAMLTLPWAICWRPFRAWIMGYFVCRLHLSD